MFRNGLKAAILITIVAGVIVYFFLYTKRKITNNSVTNIINVITMKISSRAFADSGSIPSRYTCDGENINPGILIEDVPAEAKSLALIMDDPDVPKNLHPEGIWTHWVLFNINPDTRIIPENSIPAGAIVGANSRGDSKYAGPCPPDREHRYFFRLYALDDMLNLTERATKSDLGTAMEGHIILQMELVGLYKRPGM